MFPSTRSERAVDSAPSRRPFSRDVQESLPQGFVGRHVDMVWTSASSCAEAAPHGGGCHLWSCDGWLPHGLAVNVLRGRVWLQVSQLTLLVFWYGYVGTSGGHQYNLVNMIVGLKPKRRMIALTGDNGVGKSTVALAVARYLADRHVFPHGVHFLSYVP